MTKLTRQILRLVTLVSAALFLISAMMNLGSKIPLGFIVLSFSAPSSSIAADELAIGIVLIVAAVLSRLYVYGGAYIFATVGITFGLLSSDVQGLARSMHEAMVPFATAGWILLAIEVRGAYQSRSNTLPSKKNRDLVIALQFFVGALVTLGGAAFARGGTYPDGTALGIIHLFVGLTGLFAGYAFLRRKSYSYRLLIAINVITIAYSAFAESLAEIYAYLPPGINDALIGTIIAIIVSSVILVLLPTVSPQAKRSITNVSENLS